MNATARKTATLNLRIDPAIKEALRRAAEREHRSIANRIEVMVRDHRDRAGVVVSEQGQRLGGDHG